MGLPPSPSPPARAGPVKSKPRAHMSSPRARSRQGRRPPSLLLRRMCYCWRSGEEIDSPPFSPSESNAPALRRAHVGPRRWQQHQRPVAGTLAGAAKWVDTRHTRWHVGPTAVGPARQWVIRVTRVAVSGCTGAVGAHGRTGTCRWARVAPQWTREEAGARATPPRAEELLGGGTPHQGWPSRWEPGRFDRFPVRKITGNRSLTGLKNQGKPSRPVYRSVCPVFRSVFEACKPDWVRFGEPCTAPASCQR
jgi:hypothetical protein